MVVVADDIDERSILDRVSEALLAVRAPNRVGATQLEMVLASGCREELGAMARDPKSTL